MWLVRGLVAEGNIWKGGGAIRSAKPGRAGNFFGSVWRRHVQIKKNSGKIFFKKFQEDPEKFKKIFKFENFRKSGTEQSGIHLPQHDNIEMI